MRHVRHRCPDLRVLPMDTPFYRKCSKALRSLLQQCFACVVQTSVDDYYVDATLEVRQLIDSAQPEAVDTTGLRSRLLQGDWLHAARQLMADGEPRAASVQVTVLTPQSQAVQSLTRFVWCDVHGNRS